MVPFSFGSSLFLIYFFFSYISPGFPGPLLSGFPMNKNHDHTISKRSRKRRDLLRARGLVRRDVWIDPSNPDDLLLLKKLDRSKLDQP